MKYELTEQNIKALEVFLGRTDLKGSEVNEFNSIITALSNPIKEEEVKKKTK